MLDLEPDCVLAFHPDLERSKGTANMVRQAKAAAEAGNGPLERGGEPTRLGEALKEAIR
jgi:hypothetical protein